MIYMKVFKVLKPTCLQSMKKHPLLFSSLYLEILYFAKAFKKISLQATNNITYPTGSCYPLKSSTLCSLRLWVAWKCPCLLVQSSQISRTVESFSTTRASTSNSTGKNKCRVRSLELTQWIWLAWEKAECCKPGFGLFKLRKIVVD